MTKETLIKTILKAYIIAYLFMIVSATIFYNIGVTTGYNQARDELEFHTEQIFLKNESSIIETEIIELHNGDVVCINNCTIRYNNENGARIESVTINKGTPHHYGECHHD